MYAAQWAPREFKSSPLSQVTRHKISEALKFTDFNEYMIALKL